MAAATAKPITIPVVPVVAGAGLASAAASTGALSTAMTEAAASTATVAGALETEAAAAAQSAGANTAAAEATAVLAANQKAAASAAKDLAASQAAQSAKIAQLSRGAAASGLSLVGLRGATLAASGAFLAGTAAVVGFAKAIQSSANLETELNVFRVTAGATADEMNRVSEAARALGRDITLPGVTAGTAAEAMTELAKAGLSVQDSISGARGALQLATAAQIDVKDATTLTAGALNAFQLNGTEAVRVADLLTGAAKESQGEITDMSTALGQAAAVSHLFGVSIEDTVALLTELAQAGISGGRAGTSLRVAFLRLVNPPADAARALKQLNVQLRDAQGNLRPEVFTDITAALAGYTRAQRQATLATIFGADAVRTAAIIGNKGSEAFLQTRDAVTESGLAQQQAAARTQGLTGDVLNLQNQVSALGLQLGDVAKGPTSSLVKALADIVDAAVEAGDEVGNLKKKLDDLFDFKVPGSGETGTSLGDKVVKALFMTSPAFIRLTKQTLDNTILGVINDARDTVRREIGIANLAKNGGTFGVTSLEGILGDVGPTFGVSQLNNIKAAAQKIGLGVKEIQNVIGGFDAEEVRAKIAGNNKQLVDVLQTEQAFLERQLQRDVVKNRPALKRLIESALLGVVNDIDSIQSKAESDAAALKAKAAKAASDAAQAVRDREQGLLSRFGIERDQKQNKIAQEAQKAGLQGDINAEKAFKALVLGQIAAVRERISVEGGRKAAIVALQAILTQIDGQLKSLAKQQQDDQKRQRDALIQGTRLDIDFDQTTENKKKEIDDRKKLIRQLKVELATVKQGTNAYKEIRNAIAEQNAALKEIAAERQKGQSFAQASFEFLQAQQGFASNLLGNLIPTGATGGLVGGGSPVQAALTPVAGLADGKSTSGPTSGQAQTTNAVLLRILDQLKILNGSQQAPEAQRQNRVQQAVMDGGVGG